VAHRHRAQKAGGGRTVYAGAGSNVAKEAENRSDSFGHGGRKKHHEHHAFGGTAKPRLDKRARGGRTGANHSPFSSAAHMEDMKRTPSTKDHEQPRKSGGRAFAKGGGVRPHAHAKHEFNFGHHHGAGHEEPLETHPPAELKKGGVPKKHKHASGGRTALACGGKAMKDGGDDEEDEPRHKSADGGRWIQAATNKMEKKGTVGSLHRALDVPEGNKIPAKKLSKAEHSSSPALRKKANFAANVRGG
jgi:hypothetical protein